MDGFVEGGYVCEGLVGEVMGVKIAPDRLDFIEFGGVFRQPLEGEPVCAGGQGGERAFAGVDRMRIVLDQHDRLGLSPGLRSKGARRSSCSTRCAMKSALLRLVGLVWTMRLARDVIERPQHRDLLGLPRGRHTQVPPPTSPRRGRDRDA